MVGPAAGEVVEQGVFENPTQAADPRVDLIESDELGGLPPVNIINAEIDLQGEWREARKAGTGPLAPARLLSDKNAWLTARNLTKRN